MVRIRDMFKKWQRRALQKAHSFSDASICTLNNSAALSLHTRRSISMPSIRDGGRSRPTGSATGKVPPGHLAVSVGAERQRFVIKMSYLSHPLFKALLKRTEEEIGFGCEGPLALACKVPAFVRLLHIIQSSGKAHHRSNSMGEDACIAADEQQYEGLLQQLLESADLSEQAVSREVHSRWNLRSQGRLSQPSVA